MIMISIEMRQFKHNTTNVGYNTNRIYLCIYFQSSLISQRFHF